MQIYNCMHACMHACMHMKQKEKKEMKKRNKIKVCPYMVYCCSNSFANFFVFVCCLEQTNSKTNRRNLIEYEGPPELSRKTLEESKRKEDKTIYINII